MAGEHDIVTETYVYVYELLQSASEVKDKSGCRQMTDAEFQDYKRTIVARDLELVGLIKDLVRHGKDLAAASPEGAQTEELNDPLKLKLRLIKWDTTFTQLAIKRVLDDAKSLVEVLKTR